MPQLFYDSSLPEAYSNNEVSTKERAPSLHITKPALKSALLVMAWVIVAAVSVGGGFAIWRHDQQSSSTTIRYGLFYRTGFFLAHCGSHNTISAAQLILNDTSLAALTLANRDRQLFFQDDTGLIRRLIRTASNNQWSTSADQNLSFTSNPRSYTPLAVTLNDITRVLIRRWRMHSTQVYFK